MKETLIGTVLGDGYLEPHGRGARLQVNHSVRLKAYVLPELRYKLPFPVTTEGMRARDRRPAEAGHSTAPIIRRLLRSFRRMEL